MGLVAVGTEWKGHSFSFIGAPPAALSIVVVFVVVPVGAWGRLAGLLVVGYWDLGFGR
jgi:hypothetical protein